MVNKCSLQNILDSILAVGNQEQNQFLPPSIYSSMFNTVTSLLISSLVKLYPKDPQVLDMLDPFVEFKMVPVNNSIFNLPQEYRNILGSPYIFSNPSGECGNIPEITTAHEFLSANLTSGCKTNPIDIIPQAEFSIRTSSTYKYPTYEKPIGFVSGKKTIKVCPYDLTKVAILYVRNEKLVNYTYTNNPDGTYVIDTTNPNFQESEWSSNAFEPIYKAMSALYAAYSRDTELRDWTRILHSEGIL